MPVDANDLGDAMTRAEAADFMHVSLPTVKRMIHDGELEFFRIRNRVFVPRRSVLAYINSTHVPMTHPQTPAPRARRGGAA